LKNNNAQQSNGYPSQPVVAVGAIVFRNNRVLLVRRGQREILEETGITIQALEPVYTFDYIERDGSAPPRFHYVIIDLTADYIDGEIRAGDDAAEARWVAAEELDGMKVSSKTLKLLKKQFDFGI
jgi:ADP-ribose pyrophosphatase